MRPHLMTISLLQFMIINLRKKTDCRNCFEFNYINLNNEEEFQEEEKSSKGLVLKELP